MNPTNHEMNNANLLREGAHEKMQIWLWNSNFLSGYADELLKDIDIQAALFGPDERMHMKHSAYGQTTGIVVMNVHSAKYLSCVDVSSVTHVAKMKRWKKKVRVAFEGET
eukprot:GILK01012782.1.p2 GENE.GILK01012782.1~~GILK01012782.1.p2  ORF type:complete len:110 (+),score=14.71 GILK01012782.1:283-612(+)